MSYHIITFYHDHNHNHDHGHDYTQKLLFYDYDHDYDCDCVYDMTMTWYGQYDISCLFCCTNMASPNAFGSYVIWWYVTWYGVEWCDKVQPVVMRCEMTRDETEWEDTVWYDMICLWDDMGATSHLIAQYHTASPHSISDHMGCIITIAIAIVMIVHMMKFVQSLLKCYDPPSDLKGKQLSNCVTTSHIRTYWSCHVTVAVMITITKQQWCCL